MRALIVYKFLRIPSRFSLYSSLHKFFIRYIAWRISKKIADADLIICCESLACYLKHPKEKIILWDEVRLNANCQQESFEEFHLFNEAAIQLLQKNTESWVNGISIPRALSYGFVASHTENLPFFISGLNEIFKKNKIEKALYFDFCLQSNLARDIALSLGIVTEHIFLGELGFYRKLTKKLHDINLSKKVSANIKRIIDQSAKSFAQIQPTDILLINSKSRGAQFLGPIFKTLGKEKSILLAGFPDSENTESQLTYLTQMFELELILGLIRKFSTTLMWVWDNARKDLALIDLKYKNVSIAKFHVQEMEKVWQERAAMAATIAYLSNDILNRLKPKCVLACDPLEISYIFYTKARSIGATVCLYHGVYNGFNSTASIWEWHLKDFDYIFTMNDWLKNRVIRGNLVARDAVEVVGDIIAKQLDKGGVEQLRQKIYSALKLNPNIPTILVLTRPESATFNLEDKIGFFKKIDNYARDLNVQSVIKGHPHEHKEDLLAFSKSLNIHWPIVVNEFNLNEMLSIAHLAINTAASSTTTGCIYARVPALIIGPMALINCSDQSSEFYSYCGSGVAMCHDINDNFAEDFKKILFDSDYRAGLIERGIVFVERFSGPLDGLAANRVSIALEKLCAPHLN